MHFSHLQFLPSVIGDGKETFSNIPSSENERVNEAGGSATDGTVNYLYMKSGRVHRIHSHILVLEKEEYQQQERQQKDMLN